MSKQFSNGADVISTNKHKLMIVTVSDDFGLGDIVKLARDDGTSCPYFDTVHSAGDFRMQTNVCEYWFYMRPATAEELMAVGLGEDEAVEPARDELIAELHTLIADMKSRVDAIEQRVPLKLVAVDHAAPEPEATVHKFSNGTTVDKSTVRAGKVYRITGNVERNRHCYDIGTLVRMVDGWDLTVNEEGMRVASCSGGADQYVYWESLEPVEVSYFLRDGQPVTEDVIRDDARFEVMGHSMFPDGTIVRLCDTASRSTAHHNQPRFYYVDGSDFWYTAWNLLRQLNEAEVAELSKQKVEDWNPQGGRWYIVGNGSVGQLGSTPEFKEYGTEFGTREAAEQAVKAFTIYHRLYKLAEELNEGWVPDWSDFDQKKWAVRYSHETCNWRPAYSLKGDDLVPVFKDHNTARRAIELITERNALGDAAKGVYVQ